MRSIQALSVLRVCLLASLICVQSLVVSSMHTYAPSPQLSWVEPALASLAHLPHLDPCPLPRPLTLTRVPGQC